MNKKVIAIVGVVAIVGITAIGVLVYKHQNS